MSTSSSDQRPRAARCFAVVPAAGVGARLGAELPKQYLQVAGDSLLGWSLRPLLAVPWIEQVLVVVAPGDTRAAIACAALGATAGERLRIAAIGGASRRDSVLAGLSALAHSHAPHCDDWVLVHDAARPGLRVGALQRLHDALAQHPVGGLLALPVADTVKSANACGEVAATLPRENLWLAQTPQMFRYGRLHQALAAHAEVTDEAAAIEGQGHAALLVQGERRNFKVTTADDLAMMSLLLHSERPIGGGASDLGKSSQEHDA